MTRGSECRSKRAILARVLWLAGAMVGVTTESFADDWPQWMGPNRDNQWREEGVVDRFPAEGLPVVWRTPIAGGYAGPAVAGDLVIITDYQTGDDVKVDNFERKTFTGIERVHALDAKSGEIRWTHEYPVTYTMSYPAGPRCTPIIHEGKVYTLGAEGHLFCYEAQTGKILWSHHFQADYEAKTPLWGFAAHPLIDGDRLICIVGGEGTHAIAFDRNTGKELWRAESSREPGYSPPLIIEAGGARQLILAKPDAVASVDPETGKSLWSVPYEATNGSIIMTPIHSGKWLYVGGYSNHNLLIELSADAPGGKEVWRDQARKAISPVNVQPMLIDQTLYGMDQSGALMAIDLETGDRVWETPRPLAEDRPLGSGTAFLNRQGDRWWLFTEQGDLIIAKIDREGYEELSRTHIIEPTNVAFGRDVVWCAPAYAGKRLFVRNDQEIICVDLSAR